MSLKQVSLAVLAASVASFNAHAANVETLSITGTIGQSPTYGSNTTIDTYGYFSAPGTDLSGKTVQIFEEYDPSALYQNTTTCTTQATIMCYEPISNGSDLYGSVYTVIVINGVRRVFAPSANYAFLDITTGSYYQIDFTAFDQTGLEGISDANLRTVATFGKPAPTDLLPGIVQQLAFQSSSPSYTFETLFYTATKVTR